MNVKNATNSRGVSAIMLVPVINSLPLPTIPNRPARIAVYLQILSITPSEVTPDPK